MTAGAGDRPDAQARDIPFRARPSPELLAVLAEQYELVPAASLTDLGGGHLNLHVPATAGPGWVVRVYAPWVSAERVSFVKKLRDGLRDAGIPAPMTLPTTGGADHVLVGGRVAEVDQYVAGRRMDEHRQLELGMTMLGRVHAVLEHLGHLRGPEPAYPNHIDASSALERAERTKAVVSAWPDVSDKERAICDDMVRLAGGLWFLEQPLQESCRVQHVHGDFWDNNVLFNDEDEITAVLDLDFSGWRPRTDDVALVLYYATATPDRQGADPGLLHWLRRCVEAYDSSLDHPLTPQELALLPLALARTVLFMTRNILALEEDASGYGAPALPAQRQMLAGMANELTWSLDLLGQAAEAQTIFGG